jgi:hypothetical protein
MSSSKIQIANIALGFLGEPALTSLSEVSLRAEQVNLHYESAVVDCLGKADWRFAVQKDWLSQDIATPQNEWPYQYTLPAGFIRVVKLEPRARYDIYGSKLYADATGLACDFVKRVSEANFPTTFETFVACELAIRMCMVITGDIDLKASLQNDRRFKFAEALSADSQQRPNVRFEHAPFINVRF